MPAAVLAEGAQRRNGQAQRLIGCRRARERERAQVPDAEVAVHVTSNERSEVGVAHHVAAGDRAPPARVVVVEDRWGVRTRRRARRTESGRRDVPLHAAPAVVQPDGCPLRREVDLLARALPDVADREVAGGAVEREAPGVAQPVGVHLGGRAARPGVDAEDLPQSTARVLRVVGRVVARAAVAGADVQEAVGAELQLPAVVVAVRGMVDLEHRPPGRRIGEVRLRRRAVELLDRDDAAVGVARPRSRVVDVEEPAGGVVGRERHRQEPLLAYRDDAAGEVEERRAEDGAVADHVDRPVLVDHEQAVRVGRRRGDVRGRVEVPDLRQRRRRRRVGGGRRRQRHGREQRSDEPPGQHTSRNG